MKAICVKALALFVLATAGGTEGVVAIEPANPSWSPDGSRIAFADLGGRRGRLEVMRTSDGRTAHNLYSSDTCCGPVAWAASGQVVFVDDFRLMSVTAVGGKPSELFRDSSWFILSPNRETVAFDDGCGCGHAPDAIGFGGARGGSPRLIAKPKNASDEIDGFSPDGTALVFTRYPFTDEPDRNRPTLMVEELAGGSPVPLGRSGLIGAARLPRAADHAQWSPDGRWIAFVIAQKLAIVSTSAAPPRVVVPSFGGGQSFSWSASSKQLAYVAPNTRFGNLRLAAVDPHGNRTTLWTGPPYYQSSDSRIRPQWSPDGRKLVFAGGGIWVVDATGHGLKRLVEW
jgi:Tol biopolymer transport system component